jgi:3,4-dihydroxy 2-butanone 4-phosphate synthase/GTP cyclohydrolase II
LQRALQKIEENGSGILLYMRQEGRGIGLTNKIRAYSLQEKGYDTVETNEKLGFPQDARDYFAAAQILKDLGVQHIRLMTNNPKKIEGLRECGLIVTERIPIYVKPNKSNKSYLLTKQKKMGHLLTALS